MKTIKDLRIYKKCLIVVDMVNGFVREGILHDESIAVTLKKQKKLISNYIKEGELIIFVKDTHTVDSTEFKRFGNTKHCLKDTRESELVDELKNFETRDNTLSIEKNSTSFMEAPKFRSVIKDLTNVKRFDVVGCCTDICVFNGTMGLANYMDEHNNDVDIYVYEDAVATYNEENRQEYVNAAKLLMEQQGICLVKKK